jgi:hypothetical protein|tara:strand:+ start:44 stop:460 length:417 start_codon:yes stop_codon:yes gene_type:complete
MHARLNKILIGGFGENPYKSNYVDKSGNDYLSLPLTFNKYFRMKEFFKDMLRQFHDSPFFAEQKAVYDLNNLSLYNRFEDALSNQDQNGKMGLIKNLRAGSVSKSLHPLKVSKSLFWFVKVRFDEIKYRLAALIKRFR